MVPEEMVEKKSKKKGGWGYTVISLYILQMVDGRNEKELINAMVTDLANIYNSDILYRVMRGGMAEMRIREWLQRGLIERREDGRYKLTEAGKELLEDGLKLMRRMVK